MVDDLDMNLIHELEDNGMQTQSVLGAKLGAAEGTIRRRQRRLLDNHVMKFAGVPNAVALGYHMAATIGIKVDQLKTGGLVDFLESNRRVRYVASCTGRFDLLCLTVNRSEEDLSNLLKELAGIPGVNSTETFLNLEVFKSTPVTFDKSPDQVGRTPQPRQ